MPMPERHATPYDKGRRGAESRDAKNVLLSQLGEGQLSACDLKTLLKSGGVIDNFAGSDRTTMRQIRKLFGTVKGLQRLSRTAGFSQQIRDELLLLYPRIAYAERRNHVTKEFREVFVTMLNKVVDAPQGSEAKEFDRFVDLLEAIVAYKKEEG